jgi:hypothetical protein
MIKNVPLGRKGNGGWVVWAVGCGVRGAGSRLRVVGSGLQVVGSGVQE